MKIIEIIVSPSGQTRVETKGFAGAECRQASEFVPVDGVDPGVLEQVAPRAVSKLDAAAGGGAVKQV